MSRNHDGPPECQCSTCLSDYVGRSSICVDYYTKSEATKLRDAIRKAGWAVMETSGEWSIHCVTDAAKKAEEIEMQLINDNIDLTRAVDSLRRALRIEIEDIQRRSRGSTHWEGCENDHPTCAAIARMRAAIIATSLDDVRRPKE